MAPDLPRRLARATLALAMTLTAAIGTLLTATTPATAAATTSNLVAPAPYGADPWMGYYNGNYYLAATTWNNQVVVKKAASVTQLSGAAYSVVYTGAGSTVCCNAWAPELHLLDGPNGKRWYLYYTAGTAACCDGQRSVVLESSGTDPMGPYHFAAQLPVQNNGWAIDGSVATIAGKLYFFYSAWVGDQQSLFIAPMSNPWTISGAATRIAAPTNAWETSGAKVNEAPHILQHGGKTFLTFSASSCTTPDYKIGMLTLTGADPMIATSWVEKSTALFQRSDANGVFGPGHHAFFTSPDGTETWMVYHANDSATQGCAGTRTARITKVNWNSDGTPNLGTPVASGTTITAPSGDPGGTVTFPVAGTRYRLVNQSSGKVLDATDCGTANGTGVRQWSSLGNSCQQWSFTRVAGGYYTITSVNSGKVLDSVNCGTADGAGIDLWTALGNACQQWSVTPVGTRYLIANRGNGKVLDVADCSAADGAAVRQWTALGNNCQSWNITP